MDKLLNSIGEWFSGFFIWAIHQAWLMQLLAAIILVLLVIAVLSDDSF